MKPGMNTAHEPACFVNPTGTIRNVQDRGNSVRKALGIRVCRGEADGGFFGRESVNHPIFLEIRGLESIDLMKIQR